MADHLPPEDLLLDYATGTLPEPLSLLVATHIALAPESRRQVRELEEIGGALLEETQPAEMSPNALDAVMARLDAAPAADADNDGVRLPDGAQLPDGAMIDMAVPKPLRGYLAGTGKKAGWRQRGGAVSELDLLPDYPGYKTRLLRIAAGASIPQHTHDGAEYTLVLEGSFADATGWYTRGDVSVADDEVTHQPVAGKECDCICLAVTDAPLKMTGPFGRILNYFVDM